MLLNDDDRALLNASPDLATFYKTLALFASTAVSYVTSGSTGADRIAKAQAATALFLPVMHTMSQSQGSPGGDCYWDPVSEQIVCPQAEASQATAT